MTTRVSSTGRSPNPNSNPNLTTTPTQAQPLTRQEFLQILVRIATARYVLTGRVQGVSHAVRLDIDRCLPLR